MIARRHGLSAPWLVQALLDRRIRGFRTGCAAPSLMAILLSPADLGTGRLTLSVSEAATVLRVSEDTVMNRLGCTPDHQVNGFELRDADATRTRPLSNLRERS